jgi:hypothetical protein
MNLKQLISEVLINKGIINESDCNCGPIKRTKAPILNENLAPREILSEGLQYHIDNKKPLTEHVYRAGSQAYFNLWAEARALYTRGILDFYGDDLSILTETNLGEFGLYEGKKVPLDFIFEEENNYQDIVDDIKLYRTIYESVNVENSYSLDDIESNETSNSFIFTDKHGVQRKLSYFKGGSIKLLWLDPSTNKWSTEKIPSKYEDEKVMNTFGKILVKIILPKYKSFTFKALNAARYRLFRALIYTSLDTSKYDMDFNDETMEIDVYSKNESIEEAKKKPKKKDPPLNKPKRGGAKKFFVYVRDPKTKNIKKVSFGQVGMSAKINDPKARKAFAARHKCGQGEKPTSPKYWSCRLPRYSKLLGLKSNFSGFW